MTPQQLTADEEPIARHACGEGWVICTGCNARLCSFDLPPGVYKDITRDCPTPQECKTK